MCSAGFKIVKVGSKNTCEAVRARRVLLENLGIQSLFDDFLG